jgi:hypothetical protein
LILACQGLEEENSDQKSPGPPGWGLMQQASPLLIGKRKLLKSPLELLLLLLLLLLLYAGRYSISTLGNFTLALSYDFFACYLYHGVSPR